MEEKALGRDEGARRRARSRFADKKQRFQDAVKPVWDKYGAKHAGLIEQIQAVQ